MSSTDDDSSVSSLEDHFLDGLSDGEREKKRKALEEDGTASKKMKKDAEDDGTRKDCQASEPQPPGLPHVDDNKCRCSLQSGAGTILPSRRHEEAVG